MNVRAQGGAAAVAAAEAAGAAVVSAAEVLGEVFAAIAALRRRPVCVIV